MSNKFTTYSSYKMSSRVFQSIRDSVVSFSSNLAYETVKNNVFKMSNVILVVIFLICYFCYYSRRFEVITQKLKRLLLTSFPYKRTAKQARFCHSLVSNVRTFFRLAFLVLSAFLLGSGLYYSLYDDTKAAVMSFLGVAASVFTKCIFQNDRNLNSAILKNIELVASYLMSTGLFFLIIPELRPTAFYSICLGKIVHKIILEVQEMEILNNSYLLRNGGRKEQLIKFKVSSKALNVSRIVSEETDETKLNDCDMGHQSTISNITYNSEKVDSEDDSQEQTNFVLEKNNSIFYANDQDNFVQEICLENKVPISNFDEILEPSSNTEDQNPVCGRIHDFTAPPKKRYLRQCCDDKNHAITKNEESVISNTDVPIDIKAGHIVRTDLDSACEDLSKDNAGLDFSQKTLGDGCEMGYLPAESCDEKDNVINKPGKPSILNANSLPGHVLELGHIVDKCLELVSVGDGQSNDNISSEYISERSLACNFEIMHHPTAAKVEYQEKDNLVNDSEQQRNSASKENISLIRGYDQANVNDRVRLFNDSDNAPIRISNPDEQIIVSEVRYRRSSKHRYIAPKKRYLKPSSEEKDHVIIKTDESSASNADIGPVHVNETNVSERVNSASGCDGLNEDNISVEYIPQKTLAHTHELERHSIISNVDDGKKYSSENDSQEQRNSISDINDSDLSVCDQGNIVYDLVQHACLPKNSDTVPIRISKLGETCDDRSDTKSVSLERDFIPPLKKRLLEKPCEDKDLAIIETEELSISNSEIVPMHQANKQIVGEHVDLDIGHRPDHISLEVNFPQTLAHTCTTWSPSKVSNVDNSKENDDLRDELVAQRNSLSEKNVCILKTDDGENFQQTCLVKNKASVEISNFDETMEQCSKCKANYWVSSTHKCITTHKKRLLRQYASEESFISCESELLSQNSEEACPVQNKASVQQSNDNVNTELTKQCARSREPLSENDLAKDRCTRRKTRASIDADTIMQSVRLYSSVDNVVNEIDLRFIYALP